MSSIKLEVGKFYRQRNGEVVGPLTLMSRKTEWPFVVGGSAIPGWTPEGRYDPEPKADHECDLIEEVPAPGAGLKFDAGKPPLGLIPRSALLAEAGVLAHGVEKYAAHNWRQGMRWSRLGDAAMRHLLAWLDGEDIDPESGLPHLAHLRCCAGFLLDYAQTGAGTDDRYKPTA